jgi:hypothetical protein
MAKNINRKKQKEFLDLKAPTYQNKKNGQISIVLPKKELKKMIDAKDDYLIPKTIPIRIFQWRK